MRSGPDYIQFYPTLRCNRACGFCFNRSMAGMEDMQLSAFERMLEVLKQKGVQTLDIIGGEPTLHGAIVDLVRRAAGGGLFVNLSSNGSRPDILEKIMDLGPRVRVGISINDQETLAQTAAFIRSRRPVVKTVYFPGQGSTLAKAVLDLHPAQYYLIYRDALDRGELALTVAFDRFLSAVEAEYDPALTGTVYCSGFLPDEGYPELRYVRCPAGTTKLGIMPDGSVYPCNLFFGRKEFRLGNILTDPF
ncbi:MAG TPA: radical SAM protein, partial [Nitrospirota bacterium]|nr:radical SAM protein [Nitrospirota bacterium]